MKGNNMKKEIKNRLKELSEEKFKKFQSKLCPNVNNILGVRIPVLKKYAEELIKTYEPEILINEIDNEYYEEKMLQGILIGSIKNKDIYKIQEYIRNFVPKIDNWAICDTFRSGLKITKKYKQEMWDFIQIYSESKREFEIRFYVVMLLDYYVEQQYLDKIFSKLENIYNEEYYVKMAIAWLLSKCLVYFYEETVEFLTKTKLDKFTKNKSIQKAIESYRISDIRKKELRNLKQY